METTKQKYILLPTKVRLTIWSYLTGSEFYALRHLFSSDSTKVIQQYIKSIGLSLWKNEEEMWKLAVQAVSCSLPSMFSAFCYLVKQNKASAIEKLMDAIFRQVIYVEAMQKKANGLIPINIWQTISRFPFVTPSAVVELESNHLLRRQIYSGIINKPTPEGVSAFFLVCQYGYIETFNLFKTFEPNINFTDSKGNSCISQAIIAGHCFISEELIKMGANCTALNGSSQSPLMLACMHRIESVAFLLINKIKSANLTENQKALSIACEQGLLTLVSSLITKGVNVNNDQYEGKTPFICACENNHTNVLNYLISHGADVNLSSKGYNGLLAAIKFGHIELAKALLSAGADPVGKNSIENSAFGVALQTGCYRILKHLTAKYRPNQYEVSRLLVKYKDIPVEVKNTLLTNEGCGIELGLKQETREKPQTRPQTVKVPAPSMDVMQVLGATISPVNRYYIHPKMLRTIKIPAAKIKIKVKKKPIIKQCNIHLINGSIRSLTMSSAPLTPKPKEVKRASRNQSVVALSRAQSPNTLDSAYFSYTSPEKGERQHTPSLSKKTSVRPKTAMNRDLQDVLGKPNGSKKVLQRPRSAVSPSATPVLSKLNFPNKKEKLDSVANNSDDEFIQTDRQYLSVPRIACEVERKPASKAKKGGKNIKKLNKKRPESVCLLGNAKYPQRKNSVEVTPKEYKSTAIDTGTRIDPTKPAKIVNLLKTISADTIRSMFARPLQPNPSTITGIQGRKTVLSPRAMKPLFFLAYTNQ